MLPFLQFCEAMKVGHVPVSQEDAAAALQRYKKLEDSTPTAGQVGRYAGIGAVAAPTVALARDAIRGGKWSDWKGRGGVRNVLGHAVAGAATSGGIPLLRAHLDREAEKSTLRKYIAQGQAPTSPKIAASAPTRGGFLMASELAPWKQPKLHTPIQSDPQQIVEKMGAARMEWLQKRAAATTPAGRLASSHRVGLPKSSPPPGPSIADTAPTFGQRLPGANKTTIGKRTMREFPTPATS